MHCIAIKYNYLRSAPLPKPQPPPVFTRTTTKFDMPKAAEVKIDPRPIVVFSPDVNRSKTMSEPNKQLTFPVEPCEPIRVADGKKKEVLYIIQA